MSALEHLKDRHRHYAVADIVEMHQPRGHALRQLT